MVGPLAVLHVFLYLIASNNRVLLLYACIHKISLKYLFPEEIAIEICCQKGQQPTQALVSGKKI
jgi:hypothetical protein